MWSLFQCWVTVVVFVGVGAIVLWVIAAVIYHAVKR